MFLTYLKRFYAKLIRFLNPPISVTRSRHCLTLRTHPNGERFLAAFFIGLGILILVSVRLEDLVPVIPAILMISGGLVWLREQGGATIIHFDRQQELVTIRHHKLLGAEAEIFEIAIADILDIEVEKMSSSSLHDPHDRGFGTQIISHHFHLLLKLREGYHLPLMRYKDGKESERKQQALAQEIKTFLSL